MERSDQRSQGSGPLIALLVTVAAGLASVPLRPAPAVAAGVVGTGTAESCTESALDVALAGGGLVTFDCGPGQAIIEISTKTIASDTAIDGGGDIILSGGENRNKAFSVSQGVNFMVNRLTIADADNSKDGTGGGISNEGTLTVTNSAFTRNFAFDGGGIFNYQNGILTVTNCSFAANGTRENGGGGAISNVGMLTVTNSTFTGNGGGAIDIHGGAIDNEGTLAVLGSTFTGNSAYFGGAISNSGSLSVTNSTFVANSVSLISANDGTVSGFGGSAYGGALLNDGDVTVTNSTFTQNRADGGAQGTIVNQRGAFLLRNTIIGSLERCRGDFIDGGHNLDDGGCGSSAANGSIIGANPRLDPAGLQDNGGPTQTIALLPGSPAIAAGDSEACANPPVNGLDQRDSVRPGVGHTRCSIGAFESDYPAPPCTGDCDSNGEVAIDELISGVNIVLAIQPDTTCPAFLNAGGMVDIAQIIKGVKNALSGCGGG
jgi:hypothetical protein